MTTAPLLFVWTDDGAMVPAGPHWARQADKAFVIGMRYRMEEAQERSQKSHAHYFALVNKGWQNLPENLSERHPTPEHLRKWALIHAGYRDERQLVAASRAEAIRLASFIRPMDDYAIVTVTDAVVRVYTAKSQNMRAMNRQEFQASKDAVLAIIGELIGAALTEPKQARAA